MSTHREYAYETGGRSHHRRTSPGGLRVDSHPKERHSRRSTSRHREERHDFRSQQPPTQHRDHQHRYESVHYDDPRRRSKYDDFTEYSRSSRPSRQYWPPRPFAEDEVTSLRREAGSAARIRELRKDDVQCRGTIDQEPVVIDLREPKVEPKVESQPKRKSNNQDVPRNAYRDSRDSSAYPTPQSSEDERAYNPRHRPSKLEFDSSSVIPEMRERVSSPYTFNGSKDTRKSGDSAWGTSSELNNLRESQTSASYDSRKRRSLSPEPGYMAPSSPRQDSPRGPASRQNRDNVPSYASSDDRAARNRSDNAHESNHRPRESAREPRETGRNYPDAGARTAKPAAMDRDDPQRADLLDRRRPEALPRTISSNIFDDHDLYPPPSLATSKTFHESSSSTFVRPALVASLTDLGSYSRDPNYSRSRPESPAASLKDDPLSSKTPPRSSYTSVEGLAQNTSAPGSRASSQHSSRPASPLPSTRTSAASGSSGGGSRMPSTDAEWDQLQSSASSRKNTKIPASRLSAQLVLSPELIPRESEYPPPAALLPPSKQPPMPKPVTQQALPYPVDDGLMSTPLVMMPKYNEHQWRADEGYITRLVNGSINAASSPQYNPTHSGLPYAAAATVNFPSVDPAYIPDSDRDTYEDRAVSRVQKLAQAVKAAPPHCQRYYAQAGGAGWYTVRNATILHLCPDCVEPLLGTPYEAHLRRFKSSQSSSSPKVYCSFEMPWMVRAWMYTLHDGRTDLSTLAAIADTSRCTAAHARAPLRSARMPLLPSATAGFHLCEEDYRKVKLLLPRVAGLFADRPVSATAPEDREIAERAHFCAIHAEDLAFRAYWTALEKINSLAKGGAPLDPGPLMDVLAAKLEKEKRKREMDTLKGWEQAINRR